MVLVVSILLATTLVFVRFFLTHPEYWATLTGVSVATVGWIVLLNLVGLTILVAINACLLRFCGVKLGFLEQFQLTSYSAIANFFGPLQSGPGVRAVYLKTKYGVRLRDYSLAAALYYAVFAVLSAVLLFGFSQPWWQALLLVAAVGAVVVGVIRRYSRGAGSAATGWHFDAAAFGVLVILTALQLVVIALWYFVELKAVAPAVTLRQALIYSGAANFALFVSLTPDAIGFREAFLIFSARLHGLATAAIISANLLDRAVYAAFLGGVFLVLLVTHATRRFKGFPKPAPAAQQ